MTTNKKHKKIRAESNRTAILKFYTKIRMNLWSHSCREFGLKSNPLQPTKITLFFHFRVAVHSQQAAQATLIFCRGTCNLMKQNESATISK